MGKYDLLRDYLAGRRDGRLELTMTFGEVEDLVGPLPTSARVHRASWANDSKVDAQAWRAAGWACGFGESDGRTFRLRARGGR